MAKWGFGKWSGPPSSVQQPYVIGGMKGPLVVSAPITKWAPGGYPTPLRTGGAQFQVAWNAGVADFRVTALKIAFIFLNENVGKLPFSNQGQVMNSCGDPGNKFTNTGQPIPLCVPAKPPVIGGGYSIVSGSLTRTVIPGQHVAFALSDIDGTSGAVSLYAWDNVGNFVNAGPIDGSPAFSTGTNGLIVDATNDAAFSQLADPSDSHLYVNSVAPVSPSTLLGAFAPPATISYPSYGAGTLDAIQQQSVAMSLDKQFLFVAATTDPSQLNLVVLKINIATGAVAAASSPVAVGQAPLGLWVSADGARVYAAGLSFSSTLAPMVATFDTAALGLINQTTASDIGEPQCSAISPDSSSIAVTTGTTTVSCWIFDTAAFTWSSFTATSGANESNCPVTYTDNSHVLIAVGTSVVPVIQVFSTSGVAGASYSPTITHHTGFWQFVTEPNSGLIYGTSRTAVLNEGRVWVYDLGTSSTLTDQSVFVWNNAFSYMPCIAFPQ